MKIALIFTLSISFSLFAAEEIVSVGKVNYLKGSASRNDEDIVGGTLVYEGDIVETSSESVVRILFTDESVLTIAPNTKMKIEMYDRGDKGLFNLLQGVLRATVSAGQAPKKAKEHSLIVKTPSAALGVRGTDFQVIYNPQNKVSNLLTFSGKVVIKELTSTRYNYVDLDNMLSHPKNIVLKKGEFSANNLLTQRLNRPTQISRKQFFALKRNPLFKRSKKKKSSLKMAPRGILPPAVPSRVISSPTSLSSIASLKKYPNIKKVSIIQKTNQRKIFGFFDYSTEEFAPPSGGYVDQQTALYIPPAKGAKFDGNQQVYVPPKSLGTVDHLSGIYQSPPGLELTPEGKFVAKNKFVKKDLIPVINYHPKDFGKAESLTNAPPPPAPAPETLEDTFKHSDQHIDEHQRQTQTQNDSNSTTLHIVIKETD